MALDIVYLSKACIYCLQVNVLYDIQSPKQRIDKLFSDGGAYEGNEIFRYLWEIMKLPYCIKVRKRMLKLDGKKEETSLGIYQFWPRKKIYKSGKRTAA